jgi:phosphate transport system protein
MKKRHSDPSYDLDLDRIRVLLDGMADRAVEMLGGSLQALAHRDAIAAKAIAACDREVNALEVEIDEACLRLLARWQPVASDLRFVAATLKLVTDLERIGDHCANICQRVLELREEPDSPTDMGALANAVPALLQDALVAWRGENAQMAGQVIERGQRVPALVRDVVRGGFERARHDAGHVAAAMLWHEVAGALERIGAHATNIAEMVVFLVRGQDVRHLGHLPVSVEERSVP